jgi:hypothetical protein
MQPSIDILHRYVRNKYCTATQCCGSGMFIPDTGYDIFHPGILDPGLIRFRIRIRIKESKYF